jgi:hypothetical protein
MTAGHLNTRMASCSLRPLELAKARRQFANMITENACRFDFPSFAAKLTPHYSSMGRPSIDRLSGFPFEIAWANSTGWACFRRPLPVLARELWLNRDTDESDGDRIQALGPRSLSRSTRMRFKCANRASIFLRSRLDCSNARSPRACEQDLFHVEIGADL